MSPLTLPVWQVLLADVDGEVFAVSNKCSHLGLPLVGKVQGLMSPLLGDGRAVFDKL